MDHSTSHPGVQLCRQPSHMGCTSKWPRRPSGTAFFVSVLTDIHSRMPQMHLRSQARRKRRAGVSPVKTDHKNFSHLFARILELKPCFKESEISCSWSWQCWESQFHADMIHFAVVLCYCVVLVFMNNWKPDFSLIRKRYWVCAARCWSLFESGCWRVILHPTWSCCRTTHPLTSVIYCTLLTNCEGEGCNTSCLTLSNSYASTYNV